MRRTLAHNTTAEVEERIRVTEQPKPSLLRGRTARSALLLAVLTAGLFAFTSTALASKQAVDFFGGNGTLGGQFESSEGVAVNYSGAGGVPAGTIYATDGGSFDFPSQRGNRVERFQRDDNGTPGETADDTYSFIATWGAGVLTEGGSDYEICTVAAQCLQGTGTGGNGTLAGNGSLSKPSGIAVDQDSGQVYVLDSSSRRTLDNNFRVNVYSATGTFLRSFGWGVVESGPGNTGTGYEICVAANGDVCKKGTAGPGLGQFGVGGTGERAPEGIALSPPDGNPASGTVYLADQFNRRINTYNLDGTSPGSIGSAAQFETNQPTNVAVDSRGIVYASNTAGGESGTHPIERYDSQGVNGPVGFLAPIVQGVDEVQELTVSATAGTFNLTFEGDTTADLPFNASCEAISSALRALPSVDGPNVFSFGSLPCTILFFNALGVKDIPQITVANGAVPLSGGAGASVTTITQGQPGLESSSRSLAVDPDSDGAGPDTDVLYAGRTLGVIQQFGPLNQPGLLAPPTADDDRHGTNGAFGSAEGLAVEPPTGRLYAAAGGQAGQGVYVLDNAGPPPTATLDSVDNVTAKSVDLHATIDPNGPPATRYHLEYSTDGVKWLSTSEVLVGAQEDPQAITAHLEPLPIGLSPNTFYHVRLVAGRNLATPIITGELTFTTLGAPPLVETAGAPVRTTTTAQLNGRVTPLNSATSYHFEYGTDESYGQSTTSMPAGSGELTELVAEEVEGLLPDTTYHYRLVAENGVGSPVFGADMTVHTRASDVLPNQSDTFPGPPGSDRAWEQVSIPDSSGNPVGFGEAFSDDGNRAAYGIFGGTPISSTGSILSLYYSERTPSGWQTQLITPSRDQIAGQFWYGVNGPHDLSTMITLNQGSDSGTDEKEIWRLTPGSSPTLLFQRAPATHFAAENVGISADGTRVLAFLKEGTLDPAYPTAAAKVNIYDISSTTPQLISLLPGNVVSPCDSQASVALQFPGTHWVSDDGSLAYFESRPEPPCSGGASSPSLYLRELNADQTKLISGPPLSGPDCGGSLIKATPDAAFFATASRLDPTDTQPAGCGSSNDVYRYDLGDGSLKCVTCVIAGFDANVVGTGPVQIAVSDDGSRVYFTTQKRLLPGAPPNGQRGIYRVDVSSGDLTYVAPILDGEVGTAQVGAEISSDGSALAFSSDLAALNPLGGLSDNGGGIQYYRYDDTDRSLVCATCPQDGSAPVGQLPSELHIQKLNPGANRGALSGNGEILAFGTPTPLLGADQNTPGPGHSPSSGIDVYEWRDGRLLLITDGLTNWTEEPASKIVRRPVLEGITPSGNDIYFTATAAYTPDAPDALTRLYDARIGGGISFPKPPPPCPLEVCQGVPKGAPEEQEPASRNFSGPGNVPATTARPCPKGKRRVRQGGKPRCVKKQRPRKHRRAANHDRRANR
jgi:hypothetical protein